MTQIPRHHTLAPQFDVRIDHLDAVVSCTADARGLLGLEGVSPALRHRGHFREDREPTPDTPPIRSRPA